MQFLFSSVFPAPIGRDHLPCDPQFCSTAGSQVHQIGRAKGVFMVGPPFPRRQGPVWILIRVYARSQFCQADVPGRIFCGKAERFLRCRPAARAARHKRGSSAGSGCTMPRWCPRSGGDHQEGVWPLHQSHHQVQPQQPGAVEHRRHQRQPDIPPGQPGAALQQHEGDHRQHWVQGNGGRTWSW